MPVELETYIPVHPNEFQFALEHCEGVDPEACEFLHRHKDQLASLVHQRLHNRFGGLIEGYTFVDPDREASENPLGSRLSALSSRVSIKDMVETTQEMLEQANYRRLTPSEIYQALRTATAWGAKLKIRFSDYKRLRVYARGDGLGIRQARRWYRLFRKVDSAVPIYRQLVVIFERSEGNGQLHLRMFKNIPHADVDMLLPGSVKISWLDQGKIGIPTLWGFSMTVTRLMRSMWILALLGAVEIFKAIWIYIAIAIAGVLYSVKMFFSYRHARNRQLLHVAQSLYFQTLSNNKGVLLRLKDEAEQQWLTQAMVLLVVLRTRQNRGMAMRSLDAIDTLDRACEALLETLGLGPIDFDIQAAIRFLVEARVLVPPGEPTSASENGEWEFAKGGF
ncbi:MAG: DUF3754 domain-containing protein [Planctomycetota bacterium]|nr:DUF3754 domain-containing protein [Planctomycetota bacterium]